jgi:hypothetical protein
MQVQYWILVLKTIQIKTNGFEETSVPTTFQFSSFVGSRIYQPPKPPLLLNPKPP